MSRPRTLLSMAGVSGEPLPLSQSVLLVIDAQNEYLEGSMRLVGVGSALNEIESLLVRARKLAVPTVHIQHQGRSGGLFDTDAHRGQFAGQAMPLKNEKVVRKTLPNAFAGTDLQSTLAGFESRNLLVIGFMTHMCVSSTVRAALDLGIHCTVIASATATRDLPALCAEEVVLAADVQRGCLAAMADRFAIVVPTAAKLPD